MTWRHRVRLLNRTLFATASYCALSYLVLGLTPAAALTHPGYVFSALFPLLFQGLILMAFIVGQFAVMFAFLARGASYTIYPGEYDKTFDDVRGQPGAVKSAQEVLKLFLGFKTFKEAGGYPPRGILFEGPPGTGKTLLAKAIAGESKVPFLYANGSGFANMFMGMSQFRVRSMFKKARRLSDKFGGCVIFIDELDAAGGARGGVSLKSKAKQTVDKMFVGGMGQGSGIVNELLVQMDGLVTPRGLRRLFQRLLHLKPSVPFYNLLIIGATNRAETLDTALLRPGRFDRTVHVGLPDTQGRAEIAQYYLDKVRHEPVDVAKFAKATRDFSPAQIMNLVNEALILALQDGRDRLNTEDLAKAKLSEELGLTQPAEYTDREGRMIATHEAGHAVIGYLLRQGDQEVQVASIIKRDGSLGLVSSQDLEDSYLETREQVLNDICTSLAGYVAEETVFGTVSSGPSSDLQSATRAAVKYIGSYGMGERLMSFGVLDDMAAAVWDDVEAAGEVEKILQAQKARAVALIERNLPMIEGLRDALLERKEIVGDDLTEILQELEARL